MRSLYVSYVLALLVSLSVFAEPWLEPWLGKTSDKGQILIMLLAIYFAVLSNGRA